LGAAIQRLRAALAAEGLASIWLDSPDWADLVAPPAALGGLLAVGMAAGGRRP
jgi:hypothetical protein